MIDTFTLSSQLRNFGRHAAGNPWERHKHGVTTFTILLAAPALSFMLTMGMSPV